MSDVEKKETLISFSKSLSQLVGKPVFSGVFEHETEHDIRVVNEAYVSALEGKLALVTERLKSWPKWEWREGSYKPREDFKRTEELLKEIGAL